MKTILIVDDSEGDQFYTEIIFQGEFEGLNILKAYDGHEALEILEKHKDNPPELILLDINMPRMNGHDFLKEHTKEGDKKIPVVVMLTSSDQENDRGQALSYDCVRDYLVKPLKVETIHELEKLVKAVQSENI